MLLSTTFSLRMIFVYYLQAAVVFRTWSTYVAVMQCLIILYLIVKKSIGVLFPSKGFVLSQSPKIVLGNKVINFCDSVTYLAGVKISANLSDDEDIFRQVRSSYCAANKLKAKFSKCSYEVKNMLFCSYCMPFYACHLWNNFRKSSYNRIKIVYNDAYRILQNLPQFIRSRELQVSFGLNYF